MLSDHRKVRPAKFAMFMANSRLHVVKSNRCFDPLHQMIVNSNVEVVCLKLPVRNFWKCSVPSDHRKIRLAKFAIFMTHSRLHVVKSNKCFDPLHQMIVNSNVFE